MTDTEGGPLRKAFTVLDALSGASKPVTLSELSQIVNLPKSTVHRLMRVLTDLGLAVRMESKAYRLGDYVSRLAGKRAPSTVHDFDHAITPFLLELFQLTRKVVSVGVLSGQRVRHAGTLYGHGHSRLAMALRHPVPAYCCAAGKLLLAERIRPLTDFSGAAPAAYTRWTITNADRMEREFELIRRTGLSYARSEYLPELAEVAAPIYLGNTDPVAAVVVSGTVTTMDLRSVGRTLLETVGVIEEKLAGAS
ncbi:DNA-binding IclR family transcriptional regulator [Saccharopolyspora lacisalsi]|uniref:DNA-binding IclR family transcriptional regulator n=1 Tax=Halosaccharopolyspora lacisalsi TaxID=1000566 RepID=A0A839E113_9PSEU|nr:IclR family transcriptional regulator [Halosaccharopolyspora lacisalsi]MBA8826216.1 DNA-binding IclR family transcriptional regulator [Halosaccharopolyspora lacisalsi]